MVANKQKKAHELENRFYATCWFRFGTLWLRTYDVQTIYIVQLSVLCYLVRVKRNNCYFHFSQYIDEKIKHTTNDQCIGDFGSRTFFFCLFIILTGLMRLQNISTFVIGYNTVIQYSSLVVYKKRNGTEMKKWIYWWREALC